MTVSIINTATTQSTPVVASESKVSSVAAILLGGLFIFLIGFSQIEVVHNAAHDTRHSSAFPCH